MLMKIAAILGLGLAFAANANMPSKEEMMKKMMEAGTPGAEHKVLAENEGEWTFTAKNWHEPKGKAQEWKGTSSMKMALGGRFLTQTLKGDMGGMPYEGMGSIGYNNIEKRFESTWMDNMNTSGMMSVGTWDAKTKTLKDQGEHSCPFTENKKCKMRSEWTMNSKDKSTFRMFGPGADGKEYKMMEMVYTRVK